jgi:GLPGLI family protein
MILNFESYPYFESKLIFNNSGSIFAYKSKQNENLTRISDNGTNIVNAPNKTQYLIFNDNEATDLKEIRSSNKDIGIITFKTSLKWNLVKDTIKNVGKYECKLAHARFKGRIYYAWYSPEIPAGYGPWKLNGLPGLILEARDTTNEVSFILKSISDFKKEWPTFPLKKYKFYLKPKFDSLNNAKFQDKVKSMQSKQPRGLKVSYETGTKQEIEKLKP